MSTVADALARPAGDDLEARRSLHLSRWWQIAAVLLALYLVVVSQMATSTVARSYVTRGMGVVLMLVFLVFALRLTPPMRRIWLLFFGYQATVALTDIVYDYQSFHLGEVPFPGITDVGYLGSYLFAFAGLTMLARVASPGRDLEAWIDSIILSLAIIAAVAAFIVGPTVVAAGTLDAPTFVSILYPLIDVIVLAPLVRLLIVPRARNLSFTLVTLAMVLTLGIDLHYNWQVVTGNYLDYEEQWMAVFVLMTLAVAAPDAGRVAPRPLSDSDDITPVRALALTVGAMTAPVLVLVQLRHGEVAIAQWLTPIVVIVIGLVLWRAYRLLHTIQAQAGTLESLADSEARRVVKQMTPMRRKARSWPP